MEILSSAILILMAIAAIILVGKILGVVIALIALIALIAFVIITGTTAAMLFGGVGAVIIVGLIIYGLYTSLKKN